MQNQKVLLQKGISVKIQYLKANVLVGERKINKII